MSEYKVLFSIYVDDLDIVPYVRTTQKMKFISERWGKYAGSKATMRALFLQQQLEQGIQPDEQGFRYVTHGKDPFKIFMEFRVPPKLFHTRDLDNQIKAVLDAGNKVLYPDDRWCDNIYATRRPCQGDELPGARIIIYIGDRDEKHNGIGRRNCG